MPEEQGATALGRRDQTSGRPPAEGPDTGLPSRRAFLRLLAVLGGAATLGQLPQVLTERGWTKTAHAAGFDLVRDTFCGLIAFIVPGPDPYSVGQGVSTPEPGGIDANIADVLIHSLNQSLPLPPPFPPFSTTAATILNGVALLVNPLADGPFPSPFSRLSFPEKVAAFAALEGDPPTAPLAGLLVTSVAFLTYSEAGVFDPATRTLAGPPVGWLLSGYEGVADGRDEFKGYFQNRRKVTQHD